MNAPESHPAADELLRHAQWIRRMARALVKDDATAEDVVQETWVAALRHAPTQARLRPWLRQVVQNFARQHHRKSGRRREREGQAVEPTGLPGPEELSERLEMEQRLTRELARLDEPFRSTLMHRYYDGLEPAEIAERLGVPGGTVRWRLKRGLDVLRARLDDAHDGDRRAWSLALLPLARFEQATVLTTAAASIAVPGVILMNVLKIACASAAVCVIAIGLAVTGVLPESLVPWSFADEPVPVGFRPIREAEPEVQEVALLDPAPPEERVEAVPQAVIEAPPPEAAPLEAAAIDAHVFGANGPIPGAQMIVVVMGRERQAPVLSARDGFASFVAEPNEDGFTASVEFHATGFASRSVETAGHPGQTTHLGRIELAPGGAVSGRVVDDRGRGLAGCAVRVGETGIPKRQLEQRRIQPLEAGVPSTLTDRDGEFRLTGAPAGQIRIWAWKTGMLAGYTAPVEVRAGQESFGVELMLEPLSAANLVRGIVVSPDGVPVPDADLDYRHTSASAHQTMAGDTHADGEGRFEFRIPEDAKLTLTASDPEGRWGKATVADIRTGELELELRLVEARRIRITARGAGRELMTTFGLTVTAASGEHVLTRLPQAEHADGIAGFPLPTTPFRVRVTAPGHALLELGPLNPEQVGDSLEAYLDPVPGLHGRVLRDDLPVSGVEVTLHETIPEGTVMHRNGFRVSMHRDAADTARTDDEGYFLLTPREPGGYFVRAEPREGAAAEYGPFHLTGDLVGPDVELHLVEAGAIEGRVILGSGADGEGAVVGLTRGDGHARTLRAGPRGEFRFDGLMPGSWRVELRDEELRPGVTNTTTSNTPGSTPFEELEWSCTVFAGQTTYFDLHEIPADSWPIEGRLMINGAPAKGWTAALAPTGTFQVDEGPRTDLTSDGRFQLRALSEGKHRLILRGMLEERGGQFLVDEIRTSDGPWRLDLDVGQLVIQSMQAWNDEDMPPMVHYWKGPGDLFCITAPTPDGLGVARIAEAPAGPSKLVVPDQTFVPENWRVLRELEVERGGVSTIDLD